MKDTAQLENRKVIALEKIARILATIESCLLTFVDGNGSFIRIKDIGRAEVYAKHLGKKLRK